MKPARTRWLLTLAALVLFAGFGALGSWQLVRLQWKTALIERVNARVHATPAPAPSWTATVSAEQDEYRHVRLSGVWLHQLATPVMAVTELGSGFWLLTPLQQSDGSVVLVNRGFVAKAPTPAQLAEAANDTKPVTITGLLRISEPGGAFLRDNDPAHNHWYSRDVRALATARGLTRVAPYFVDADADADGDADTKAASGPNAVTSADAHGNAHTKAAASPNTAASANANAPREAPGAAAANPVGGLTVISFHNNHLVYALTWYALAAMVGAAFVWLRRGQGA
jgi:surfeit locus 1 family protein